MPRFTIVSATSLCDKTMTANAPMYADSLTEAIETVQDNMAEDFGYSNWIEYLQNMDPIIQENKSGVLYYIYDSSDAHEETYSILEHKSYEEKNQ